jgi:DNA invertase Pin-like site-specific DNA recombinase
VSGTSRDGRDELKKVLGVLGTGDVLAVVRLDRLGRSLRDLANIADEIDKAGAHLKVLEQGVDTSNAAGRAFFGMLAVFAAFETDVRRERQDEGIKKAKDNDVYKGGKRRIDRDRVLLLTSEGQGPGAIAKTLNVSRRQIYRIIVDAMPPKAAVVEPLVKPSPGKPAQSRPPTRFPAKSRSAA